MMKVNKEITSEETISEFLKPISPRRVTSRVPQYLNFFNSSKALSCHFYLLQSNDATQNHERRLMEAKLKNQNIAKDVEQGVK
jgi:hypothetical protein